MNRAAASSAQSAFADDPAPCYADVYDARVGVELVKDDDMTPAVRLHERRQTSFATTYGCFSK